MARSHFRYIVRNRSGRVIEDAAVELREPGTTDPIDASIYAASVGNTTRSNPLISNIDGEVEGWLDEPQSADMYVSDNDGAAHYPEEPDGSETWEAFTETAEVYRAPADVPGGGDGGGSTAGALRFHQMLFTEEPGRESYEETLELPEGSWVLDCTWIGARLDGVRGGWDADSAVMNIGDETFPTGYAKDFYVSTNAYGYYTYAGEEMGTFNDSWWSSVQFSVSDVRYAENLCAMNWAAASDTGAGVWYPAGGIITATITATDTYGNTGDGGRTLVRFLISTP